jgi:hypothetical protein
LDELGAFDLNLLIAFDAVMQERSVTRAGSRIGLSQPAMSRGSIACLRACGARDIHREHVSVTSMHLPH